MPGRERRRAGLALAAAVMTGLLGGVIGLGGAEFRLPILAGLFGYSARQAVPINLAISLCMVLAALPVRLKAVPVEGIPWEIGGVALGSVVAAFFGAGLLRRLPEARLARAMVALLALLGVVLMAESLMPENAPGLLPALPPPRLAAGVLCGLGIGMVSSLLGVAGGELIIPTLVLLFGIPMTQAGSLSLLVSLPTIVVGLLRQRRAGPLGDTAAWRATILPMGLGTMLGAGAGGALAGLVPAATLKLGLGAILLWSATRIGGHLGGETPRSAGQSCEARFGGRLGH